MRSAQEPIDMGDQDLNIGSNVLRSTSMCQKRSGRERSIVSSSPLSSTQGNAM
jgi:hypothetical protein